ncbi:MAG: hypothetical protein HOK71_00365 [Planctomycetaceae bacterium]|nr:hypothetical protein [Planctomycetaceae bacterium]
MSDPKPTRRRWKIALGVVVLFAFVGWLVAWPAYKRHRAIQEIERVGGSVRRQDVGPQWLQKLGFSFERVVQVNLHDTSITDDGLRNLSSLTNFRWLVLDRTRISDDGLEHLSGLTNLQGLYLNDTDITGDGLKHLGKLANLDEFGLPPFN